MQGEMLQGTNFHTLKRLLGENEANSDTEAHGSTNRPKQKENMQTLNKILHVLKIMFMSPFRLL